MNRQDRLDEKGADAKLRAEKSIREDGLLSPWIDCFVPHYREHNKVWMDYAHELNKVGQQIWNSSGDVVVGKSTHDPVAICFRMLIRALSNFQGAVILAERGMTAEADSLTRGLYETAFWMGYFNEDSAEAVKSFVADERQSQVGFTKVLRKEIVRKGGQNIPEMKKIDESVENLKNNGARMQKIDELAEKSGFLDHYPDYRLLSARSAHTSLHSLHQYIKKASDGSIEGYVMGPDGDNIGRSINASCQALSLCIAAFSVQIGGTAGDKRHIELLLKFGQMTGRA